MSEMQAPKSVEAGGWFLIGSSPVKIERLVRRFDVEIAVHSDGQEEVLCARLLRDSPYLGNGEHPAPSDKMIETLAEHHYRIVDASRSPSLGEWTDAANVLVRQETRADVRQILAGASGLIGPINRASVMSVYRILRARGEW